MHRTTEQEVARKERQARERAIPRCSVSGCRQGRTMESEMCGLHLREHEAREAAAEERDDLMGRIGAAETIDDLKDVLREIVEKTGC